MKTLIRKWLRALIGWDELSQRDERLSSLEERIAMMGEVQDIIEKKLGRMNKRDRAGDPLVVTDWETAQAAFLSDPKNFEQGKEN